MQTKIRFNKDRTTGPVVILEQNILRIGCWKAPYNEDSIQEAIEIINCPYETHEQIELYINDILSLEEEWDENEFKWKTHSWAIPQFANHLMNDELYNWKFYSYEIPQIAPNLMNAKLYNWKEDAWAVQKYAKHLMHLCPKEFLPEEDK